MCDCEKTVNAQLAEHNTRLSKAFYSGRTPSSSLIIAGEQIENGRGKKRAVIIVPCYCPFCGEAADKPAGAPEKETSR